MPTLPKKSPKKKRTHLPSLSKARLELTLDKLQKLNVDDLVKKQVGDMLKAASNPDSERIDVVIKSLPKEQRKMIDKTARGLRSISADVQARGRDKLEAMSDEEWQRLLDESIN